jgi:outer membrane protein OmpA-like peptidoglycan-associated protein
MAETTGKCTNFASCTLAYRNQPIPYTGNPVCPECGQPLDTNSATKGPSISLLVAGGVGILVLLAGLFFAFSHHKSSAPQTTASQRSEETPAPSAPAQTPEPANPPAPSVADASPAPDAAVPSVPASPTTPEPSPAAPDQAANPASTLSATPTPPAQTLATLMPAPQTAERDSPGVVSVEKTIDTNIAGGENQRVRAEVLKRIDLMPKLAPGEKQKLYARVDRAHGMGKVITVPFAMGARVVGSKEIDQLKSALQSPQLANLVKDPTVVFVLLGFADMRGDERVNQKISIDRAENVSQALKEKCGLQNVTQPVGMGGSALFDSGNLAKNRVVEVWAVVP